MRLINLDPRWLEKDGRHIGFTFLCPTCPTEDATRLTCFFEPTPFKEQVKMMLPITGKEYGDRIDWVSSRSDFAWSKGANDTFDGLTVHPSIDASASKHWHGSIICGEIK